MVLLRFVQLSDGHKLFAEIHQSKELMGRVQAVIPNTLEAEKMILMMNKKFPPLHRKRTQGQGLAGGVLDGSSQEVLLPDDDERNPSLQVGSREEVAAKQLLMVNPS